MQSIMYNYLNHERVEKVGFSSYQYYQKYVVPDALQIIRLLGRQHTKEDREKIKSMKQEDIANMIVNCMNNSHLTLYLN